MSGASTKAIRLGAAGRLIQRLLKVPLFRTSAMFALSGTAFAIGNLLLARALPVQQFGYFALAVALYNMSAQIAPMGLDQLLLRHGLAPDRRMFLRILGCGALVGGITGAAAFLSGGLEARAALAIAAAICAGGFVWVASYGLQVPGSQRQSILLATSSSWFICAIGLGAQAGSFHDALPLILMFMLGVVILGAAGWLGLRAARRGASVASRIHWREAFSLMGLTAIGTIGVQFERLIVPVTLGLRDLATFMVLASVAIFPFKLVMSGAGFSLIPRLRATADPQERRRIVRNEVITVVGFLALASLGCAALAPFATDLITNGRYQIGLPLVLAACLNGSAKVVQALPRAIIIASGSSRDLARLNRLGWMGLAAAGAGAVVGSNWGLEGLVIGAALGSLTGSVPGTLIARRALRQPTGDSADRG
jgi:hypothetical protein